MADSKAGRTAVSQGGFWNSPKVSYSQETQQLLKDMMKESKLTNFQQKHLSQIQNGGTLPSQCNPTSSARPHKRTPVRPQQQKIVNPRNSSGGIRSKETIEASGAYEKPDNRPPPKAPVISDREKRRLGNFMAYGKDLPSPRERRKWEQLQKKSESAPPSAAPKTDRFDELVKEIDERRSFLDEMETLGQGAKYKSIVQTEISQKIREMEVIDAKQTVELEKIITTDQNSSINTN